MLVGAVYPGLYGFEFVEVPPVIPPEYAPCLTSTIKVQYLTSSVALECRMVMCAEVKVRHLMSGTAPSFCPTVTATVTTRQRVVSAGMKICCVEVVS